MGLHTEGGTFCNGLRRLLCKARLIAEGAPLRALINAVRLNHEPAALGRHGRAQGCECTASSSDSQGAQEHQVSRLTVQMRSPCAWSSTNSVPAQSGQVCSYLARRPDASAIHAGPLALCANWLAAQAWGPLRQAEAGLLFTTESAQPGLELNTAQAQSEAATGTSQAWPSSVAPLQEKELQTDFPGRSSVLPSTNLPITLIRSYERPCTDRVPTLDITAAQGAKYQSSWYWGSLLQRPSRWCVF